MSVPSGAFQKIDFRKWAIFSLLILWVSTSFSQALMQTSFVVAFICWGLGRIRGRSGFDVKCDKVLWGLLAFFYFFVILSYFTSEYPIASMRGLWKISMPILIFMMSADLFSSSQNQDQFFAFLVLTCLLIMMDSLIQYVFGWDLLRHFAFQTSNAGIRLVGPFGDFGKMAAYFIMVVPILAMRFWCDLTLQGKRTNAFFVLGLAVAGFLLLLLTRSRGAFVSFMISMFCLFIYKRWFKTVGVMLLLCLALLAAVPRGMIIHADAQAKEQSLVERLVLWRRALDVIYAKPWTGTGINTYTQAHSKYDKEQNQRVQGYYAHDGYLQLGAEIGVPGILAFVLFLVMLFRRGFRAAQAVRGSPEELKLLGILTGLFAFLLYAMGDTNLQSPQSLVRFWFLAGILLARLSCHFKDDCISSSRGISG